MPSTDCPKTSIQEAAPCISFLPCLCLFTLLSHNNHPRYHRLIHPHSTGSLAASSSESRCLVLSRLSSLFYLFYFVVHLRDSSPKDSCLPPSHETLLAGFDFAHLGPLHFLVLSRLSSPFVDHFSLLFFFEADLLQRFLLYLQQETKLPRLGRCRST